MGWQENLSAAEASGLKPHQSLSLAVSTGGLKRGGVEQLLQEDALTPEHTARLLLNML